MESWPHGHGLVDVKTFSSSQCPRARGFPNHPSFHIKNSVSVAIAGSGHKNLSCVSWLRWKRCTPAVVEEKHCLECLSILHVWTTSKSQSSGAPWHAEETRLDDSWEVKIVLFFCSGLGISCLCPPTVPSTQGSVVGMPPSFPSVTGLGTCWDTTRQAGRCSQEVLLCYDLLYLV